MKNSILYIIPCRKGSKRIPNKNFKSFGESSLSEISVKTLLQAKVEPKQIILSSDSTEASDIAKKYSILFQQRSDQFSSDTTSTSETIFDLLSKNRLLKEFSYLSIIQPTSPLRTSEDIIKSRNMILENSFNSLISITECGFSRPEYLYYVKKNNLYKFSKDSIGIRSQDMPTYFYRNGSIYITKINYFLTTQSLIDNQSLCYYIMPFKRSINIDTYEDWELAELLYREHV